MTSRIKKDFYIGVALYAFLKANKDAKPILIESNENAASFSMTTNTSEDFNVYIKYTADTHSKEQYKKIWQLRFTDKDKDNLQSLLITNKPLFLFLVLGDGSSYEILILNSEEYNQIRLKTGLTIKLQGERPKMFDIVDGRKIALRIERNRIEKNFAQEVKKEYVKPRQETVVINILRKKELTLMDFLE